MRYVKQRFVDKQTVLCATHLEHIEDGIIELASLDGIVEALGYTPADAGETDAQFSRLYKELANVDKPTDAQVETAINVWMDNHPEATTTIQDGSVTAEKLADGSVTAEKLASDISLGGGGNTEALRLIFDILQRGVFTENVNARMVALYEAIESGGSGDSGGGDEPGDDPIVQTKYFVKNDLTNVTTSNSALSAVAGSVYTAILTAKDGYNLSTVTVMMGNEDVTNKVYSNGVISIFSVTGNIEITAVAKGVVEENLTPVFGDTAYPNKNTFETTPKDMSSGSAATVYAQSVLFEGASVSGGVLHVELDTTKLTYCRARIYLVDGEGNPYAHNNEAGIVSPVSGDITNTNTWVDASTATTVKFIAMNGSITCEIPEGYAVKWVYVDGIQSANVIDAELSAATKPIYAAIDAICFDGEVVTAKIVKEV